ncbi:hypothetical protein TNCV_4954241 [Trichonephila clavipes]|nr:hypothetical protein TNCV_4954241 [Trichonephila clavipes]
MSEFLTSRNKATRGLLVTDFVVLNLDQHPPPPNYHTTSTGGHRDSIVLMCTRLSTSWIYKGTSTQICDTLATSPLPRSLVYWLVFSGTKTRARDTPTTST